MSESKEHRDLIVKMARDLEARYLKLRIKKDILDKPGDITPPMIGEHKPDIYASDAKKGFHVIGEAKTVADIDNKHTYSQLEAFTSFLEMKEEGLLILGILGQKADRAKIMLYFLNLELAPKATKLQVFDGLDYWELAGTQGSTWHLI